jgi:hypothetical protein
MVKLVAANGERMVRASVRRTARLPRVTTDSPRVEAAFSQSVDHIEDTVAHYRIAPKLVLGREKLALRKLVTSRAILALSLVQKEKFAIRVESPGSMVGFRWAPTGSWRAVS